MESRGVAEGGPLKTLTDTLRGLAGEGSDDVVDEQLAKADGGRRGGNFVGNKSSKKKKLAWGDSDAAASKAAIGALLLSRETLTLAQAKASWRDAFNWTVETFAKTSSAEAAFLAQNFQGVVLWRVSISMDRGSWRDVVARLRNLVAEMTDAAVVNKLTRTGLDAGCAYGPVRLRSALNDWLEDLESAAEEAFSYTVDGLMASREPPPPFTAASAAAAATGSIPDVSSVAARLTDKKYELIYDFPAVQEGLRLVSVALGWIPAFLLTLDRTRDRAYKPLTRALFTLALVDQYFWKPGSKRPAQLVRNFSADAEELDDSAMTGPYDSNGVKRTMHDVRVSAALSYGDPFVREVEPGVTSSRLRSDPEMLDENGPLDRDAMCVHETAILRVLTSPAVGGRGKRGGGERDDERDEFLRSDDGRRVREIKVALADLAGSVWAAAQRAQSPAQLLQRLIGAGFLPKTCRAYDSALKAEFTRKRYGGGGGGGREPSSSSSSAVIFDETQQAVGCVAALGNAAYGLAEIYGPGMDYLDSFLYAMGPDETEWADFYAALGLPDGAITSVLRRGMPPRVFPNYVKNIRATLTEELAGSERLAGSVSGRGDLAVSASPSYSSSLGNSARESVLLWFDRRADELWGITPPTPTAVASKEKSSSSSAAVVLDDRGGVGVSVASDRHGSPGQKDAIMASAAASARYPKPAPDKPELKTPDFAKYVVASVGADALVSLASASFTASHIATAVDVVTWARNYGGLEIGSFEDHRAKLNAIVYALLPFSGDEPKTPTPGDVAELESLMGELHSAVETAILALPEGARPEIPEKPTAANSSFLISANATAARLSLEALSERTDGLAETAATLAWSVADLVWTLKCFFGAEFSPSKGHAGAVTVSVTGEAVGTWTARDLAAAAAEAYGDCADAIAEARVLAVSLRTLVQDTAASRSACENLVTRAISLHHHDVNLRRRGDRPHAAAADDDYGAAARIYASIGADHSSLSEIQTALSSHVRKLTSGTVPPGLRSVARALEIVAELGAVADAAADPQRLFLAAVEAASSAWREVEELAGEEALALEAAAAERLKRVSSENATRGGGRGTGGKRRGDDDGDDDYEDGRRDKIPSPEEVSTAIGDVTAEYAKLPPDGRPLGAVELSSKYNVSAPSDLDGRPLKFGAVTPEGADALIDGAYENLIKERVSAAALLNIADSILSGKTGTTTASSHLPIGGCQAVNRAVLAVS